MPNEPIYQVRWLKYPFLKILIPYVCGVICSKWTQIPSISIITVFFGLFFWLYLSHKKAIHDFKFQEWFGIGIFILFFLFGIFWSTARDERNFKDHYSWNSADRNFTELICKVHSIEEKEKYWDCYSEAEYQKMDSAWASVNGTLLIRIPKKQQYIPATRDIIQGKFLILVPDKKSGPNEFDWSVLLSNRNIHAITYAETNKIKIVQRAEASFLEKTRLWSDSLVLSIFKDERDYPVATAMLLGLRKKIDPELYKAYSATGAVHVLAVSGLHVGILATIFQWVFGFIFFRIRAPKWIPPLLLLVVIWFYTLLTGATPSIMRSAIMFSLFAISKLIQRDAQPINVLASAAFILLIYNPNDLYNIGFQLSFVAMAGIFIFYEPLRVLFDIKSSILQWIWKVCAVSIAAQLFIYPIVGFHFHQFAFYFWLTSLISTPFSFIILAFGVLSFLVLPFGISILHFVTIPLVYSIKWMNNLIAWIYTFPFGQLRGWWPSSLDIVLLIGVSLLLGVWLKNKSYHALRMLIWSFIVLSVVFALENFVKKTKSEFVFSVNRGVTKKWLKHKHALVEVFGDSSLLSSNYVFANCLEDATYVNLSDSFRYETNGVFLSKDELNIQGKHYILADKDLMATAKLINNAASDYELVVASNFNNQAYFKMEKNLSINTTSNVDTQVLRRYFPLAKISKRNQSFIKLNIP